MRLAQFISIHREAILEAWDSFASTLQPETRVMGAKEVRDHAGQMLTEIAADISTPQSTRQAVEKSRGEGPKARADTASEVHAGTRLRSGFTIDQLVAEYRALRASVLLLWSQEPDRDAEFREQDMLRFNEAIDKGLAESVSRYSQTVNESQDVFLGVLGHDLRTPLGVILLSAEFFLHADELDSRYTKVAAGIYTSVRRAEKIVQDLLDFARARVGSGIPVDRVEADLTVMCENVVQEVRLLHPDRTVVFQPDERIIGKFDVSRMGQVFSNLIENAVKHGSGDSPVTVSQELEDDHVVFAIHNEGEPITAEDTLRIFNPMTRHSQFALAERGPGAGLGLGLFIAQEIVTAHGGTIKVTSSAASGTTFRVRLPLRSGAAAAD
ncbi:sensor histidine kinase [Rhodanobacter soli]|uniref:sensor histidine kinase n=1 Tax=Rhodanobacter soli TaxID=590609 RepID=UPI0031CE92B8